ncbi:hypothetical protein [Enhygromyxa salina]|uniref:N(G),N(G)-dimethylarginine dimethylaminohydrolase n=1 Tax=Enhygromyxa salina TaxID=215803 RepID=A0A2S9Y850_9BACT|nr:hypothetical protein [Enhygromyxa salina]PRQ01275.1 N(G),N(G)-dimethylarginine dimethylaminohydrolase [Enhygromyxa salina]
MDRAPRSRPPARAASGLRAGAAGGLGQPDEAAAAALREQLEPLGYTLCTIPVAAGLHFKSSVNLLGHDTLVATPAFAGRPEFHGFEVIEVAEAEAYAANILRINDHVLVAAGFPELTSKLRARGFGLIVLNMSEVEKMDGGLSCLSLRL